MTNIPDEKIEQHLSDSIRKLTPDRSEQLWQQPVEQASGSEWFLDTGRQQKRTGKRYLIPAAAACLLLCIVSTLLFNLMPSAAVYLDVNPSITLKVNYRSRVTEAVACNEDAVTVLDGMDLKGTDLDVALYAILGSMVHHGYLSESKDTILVSVQSANTHRASELEEEVTAIVTQGLDEMIHAGEVLSQQVDTEDMEQEDTDKEFTPGKAVFIRQLRELYPQLKDEDLESMTVDEILALLNRENLDYSHYTDDAPLNTDSQFPDDWDDGDDDVDDDEDNDEDDDDDDDDDDDNDEDDNDNDDEDDD